MQNFQDLNPPKDQKCIAKAERTVYNTNIRISENQKRGIIMLAELRSRSQITIPAEIIKKLGISEGDKFEVVEKDGGIFLCPVVVYPKEKMLALAKLLKNAESEKDSQKEFTSVEDMFADMGLDVNV